MNYPTGMGVNTGNHYHHVAAQMHSYMRHPPQHNPYPFHGQFPQAPVIASQVLQYGAQRMGVNPMIMNGLGGFARGFMHNVLS